MREEINFDNWTDGMKVRDAKTGETGTVIGPKWWNDKYEIRMDESKTYNAEFDYYAPKFCWAYPTGNFVPVD